MTSANSTTGYDIGYIVGSISSTSLNRHLAKALERLAPAGFIQRGR